MPISFNLVPSTLRVPFTAVEFDSSQANQGDSLLPYSALIIGQKLAAGTGTADTFVRCPDIATAIALGGRGSMLHQQAKAWFAIPNNSVELWLGILADNGAGVAATGTIVVSGPATAAGTISLYLGGVLVSVAVALNDASTAIATAIGAAINAAADLPVTAGVASSTVTLTFRHKGLVGNSYDVRANYNGESLPTGVGLTITAVGSVVAGTTNPTLTALISAMSAQWFQIWTHPYTDATSLTAIETELLSRAGPLRAIDGYAIASASAAALSTLQSLGTGRNSPYSEIVAQSGNNPLTPPMEFAAGVAARVAIAASIDPARPFQTLQVDGALPVAAIDTYDVLERDTLLHSGIATTRTAAGGVVQLDRMISTYQINPSGQADTAYLDATTILNLLYLRYDFRARMQSKYPRHKLADDGTIVGSGQDIITPQQGRAEAVAWFTAKMKQGLVQNLDAFKTNLVVERNTSDRNRLDFLLPPTLMSQLIVTGAKIQFRL